jgi:hypothetical protein
MRKLLYELLRTALLSIEQDDQPVIQHVDVWNNQVEYAQEEQPFLTPAVFIEFDAIDWQPLLRGVREAVITVRLHVVTDSRQGKYEQVLPRLDLLDRINRTMYQLNATMQGVGFDVIQGNFRVGEDSKLRPADKPRSVINDIKLTRSITDHNFDELADNVEEYQCYVTDASAHDYGDKQDYCYRIVKVPRSNNQE